VDLIRTRDELTRLEDRRRRGGLALVPTMGALHDGHLSLVRLAAAHGPVVVSIFVNPTQFGPDEDFESYPRTLDDDLAALERLGVAAVFAPDTGQMYGARPGVTVQPGPRAADLCGAARPGHFAGVLTVVAKLLHLIRPTVAVFGRKDAQQCLVIAEMVRDLDFGVRLIDGETVREADGLAMSSRNRYLVGDDRRRALCLQEALDAGRVLLERGERGRGAVEAAMGAVLAAADAVEYAALRGVPDLDRPAAAAGRTLLAVAARVGPARLIDNIVLEVGDDGVAPATLLGEGEAT
jgi:pantoate--beta-alanine ligase